MKSLPLTPLEVYLFEDDVPSHPGWQFMRMRWKGHLKRAELEKAWSDTTRLHPLWHALVRRGFLGRLYWVFDATTPTIHWSRAGGSRSWPDWLPMDLVKGPAVRLYIIEDDEGTDVVMSIHHAVCDGLAVRDVVEDVFLRYAKALGDAVEPKATPTEQSLRARGHMGATFLERCWLPVLQVAGIVAESKLLRRKVAPLLPYSPGPTTGPRPAEWPALVSRLWSDEETAAIRDTAKHAKCGLPEMLMRDLQAAIGSWRLAQGVDAPDDWIRFGSAMSLRRKSRSAWPATNNFGVALIDRSARQLGNRERLLRRGKEDLDLIEKLKLGYAFWMVLRLRKWWPGGIRAYATRDVVRMTFIMSFMGKVFARTPLKRKEGLISVPGAVMEDVQGMAPTRPGTGGCADLGLVNGRLGICLHFDPRMMTRAQAEAFVEEFAAQLRRSVAGT
ncbi:MAG TPA: hypothetical protein VIJ19_09865 [Opitutaceae bacterium]